VLKVAKKNFIIFLMFGCFYITIEVFFKAFKNVDVFGLSLIGHTSIWLFFIGGTSALLVGLINETFRIPLVIEMFVGGLIITIIELITGLIFNVWLGFDLWSYSDMPLNYKGQVCLIFSVLWCFLVPCVHFLDDLLRKKL
jgi:uncharacterized membrane protein